jgi:NADH:ubiquinone oxidoreductase subunit 5 (subunit L)/multisubunit Na+/H+ antiporter MnhA subunit
MFMGAMQGLVLSDSFLMLFVFWELTSITSFLLIGFTTRARPRAAPRSRRWWSPGGGGLSLLAGLLVIWNITGVSELSLLLSTGDLLRESPFFLLALSFWCSAGPFPNRRSSRCISGCPTPWKRRRRCPPICTPPPWSRPASTC